LSEPRSRQRLWAGSARRLLERLPLQLFQHGAGEEFLRPGLGIGIGKSAGGLPSRRPPSRRSCAACARFDISIKAIEFAIEGLAGCIRARAKRCALSPRRRRAAASAQELIERSRQTAPEWAATRPPRPSSRLE
jgi:hypothetical protein